MAIAVSASAGSGARQVGTFERECAGQEPRRDRAGADVEPTAWAAGVVSLAAGVVHARHAPLHWSEDPLYGLFFYGVAAVQLVAGGWLVARPVGRRVRLVVAAVSLAVVAVWVLTRTAGVPVGSDAGSRETVGTADLAVSALEAVLAVLLLAPARLVRLRALPVVALAAAFAAVAVSAPETHGHDEVGDAHVGAEAVDPRYAPLLPTLCAATAEDDAEARRTLVRSVHGLLAELAAEVVPRSPALAARLLDVEETLRRDLDASDPDAEVIGRDLARLNGTARAALAAVGRVSEYLCRG